MYAFRRLSEVREITEKSLLPVWLIALNLNLLIMVRIFVAVYIARVYKDGINKPKYIIDWDNKELHKK